MKYLPTNIDVDYSYKYGERNGLSPTTGNMLYMRGFFYLGKKIIEITYSSNL